MTDYRPKSNSIYSQEGREKFAHDMFAIDEKFLRDVTPYIDRINRKGAGLAMKLQRTDDGQVVEAIFKLATNPDVTINCKLTGGMLKYENMLFATREDFSRLIPKIGRDLAIMGLQHSYQPPSGPGM